MYTLHWDVFSLFLSLPFSVISFPVAQVLSVPELVTLSYSEFSSRLLTKQLPSPVPKGQRRTGALIFSWTVPELKMTCGSRYALRCPYDADVARVIASIYCTDTARWLHVYLSRAFRWLLRRSWQLQPRTDFDCCLFDQNATCVAVRAVNFDGSHPFCFEKSNEYVGNIIVSVIIMKILRISADNKFLLTFL